MAEVVCSLCSCYVKASGSILVDVGTGVKHNVCWNCAHAVTRDHKKAVMRDGTGYYPTDNGGTTRRDGPGFVGRDARRR